LENTQIFVKHKFVGQHKNFWKTQICWTKQKFVDNTKIFKTTQICLEQHKHFWTKQKYDINAAQDLATVVSVLPLHVSRTFDQ
jgi:hypothetical protein